MADRGLYHLSLLVSRHWVWTVSLLSGFAVVGAVIVGPVLGGGWAAVSTFETCYGIVLAIGIFTWTLAGYATQEADRKSRGAKAFAEHATGKHFGAGELKPWQRERLAGVLKVDPDQVTSELLVWLVEQSDSQGAREAIVVTQRHWFLRVVGRGRGGLQVLDLATNRRLDDPTMSSGDC